jgi:micrococcal nuclease
MKILVAIVFLAISCSSEPKREMQTFPSLFSAKVIGIKDGDTIEVLFDGKSVAVRLAHIDCPELKKKQPFGRAAKQMTSDLCFGKDVTVINENILDRYGRLIAEIFNDKQVNVNKELVRSGLAWHFKKYSTNKEYAELEAKARASRIGLWQDVHPIAPWDWRHH